MKKTFKAMLIGAVAIMLLLPSLSLAKGITAGFKIGFNSADVFGGNVAAMEAILGDNFKSKWGLCTGGFIQFNISKMFAIQPEFLYTMKGTRFEQQILGETVKMAIKLSYLEVPVLVKFMIPTPGGVKPSLFVGPSIAIELGAKLKTEALGDTTVEDISDNTQNTEFGLIIGGGLDFGKLSFDIRYNLGLTTISISGGEEIKNGVISLKVGYSFSL